MKRIISILPPFLLAASLVGFTAPVKAHHSFAMFDKSRLVTVKGVLHKLEWANPHVYLYVDANSTGGPAKEYVIECGSINILSRRGWKVNTVKVGDTVSVTFYPLRDGHPGGMLDSIILPNGTAKKN